MGVCGQNIRKSSPGIARELDCMEIMKSGTGKPGATDPRTAIESKKVIMEMVEDAVR